MNKEEIIQIKIEKEKQIQHTISILQELSEKLEYFIKSRRIDEEQKEREIKRLSKHLIRKDDLLQKEKQTKARLDELIYKFPGETSSK